MKKILLLIVGLSIMASDSQAQSQWLLLTNVPVGTVGYGVRDDNSFNIISENFTGTFNSPVDLSTLLASPYYTGGGLDVALSSDGVSLATSETEQDFFWFPLTDSWQMAFSGAWADGSITVLPTSLGASFTPAPAPEPSGGSFLCLGLSALLMTHLTQFRSTSRRQARPTIGQPH
jgi:hypothetical protein